jgi:hypothetical protein
LKTGECDEISAEIGEKRREFERERGSWEGVGFFGMFFGMFLECFGGIHDCFWNVFLGPLFFIGVLWCHCHCHPATADCHFVACQNARSDTPNPNLPLPHNHCHFLISILLRLSTSHLSK